MKIPCSTPYRSEICHVNAGANNFDFFFFIINVAFLQDARSYIRSLPFARACCQ